MAQRGSPATRLMGNPLGGMLRDLDRRTRTTRRRSSVRKQAGEQPPPAPPAPPAPKVRRDAAAILETDEGGRVRWTFPRPFGSAPVLTALAVSPDPDGDQAVVAVLDQVDGQGAVVRVWVTRPRRGTGVAEPAGAGVQVHVTARPAA